MLHIVQQKKEAKIVFHVYNPARLTKMSAERSPLYWKNHSRTAHLIELQIYGILLITSTEQIQKSQKTVH